MQRLFFRWLRIRRLLVRRDWLLALRLVVTLRATGLETVEQRRRMRECVKPRPGIARRRKSAAGQQVANIANFFRARAESSMEDVRRRISGGAGSSNGMGPNGIAIAKAVPVAQQATSVRVAPNEMR